MMRDDDVVLGVLPLFHVYGLNAVLGGVLRHGCTLVLAERFDPHGTLDLVEAEQCTVRAAGARRSSPTGATSRGCASGWPRSGWCSPGRRRWPPRSSTDFTRAHRHPAPPGLRPDRGRPGGHQHPVLGASSSPARSVRRCPASSCGSSTTPEPPPRARTRARSRSGAPTSSAATGPTVPAVPTPTAGGRPATSGSSTQSRRPVPRRPGQGAGRSSPASTSTRSRSRRSSREVDGVAEVAVIGVPDERDRRGGGRLRPRPRRRPGRCRGRRTGAVRSAAGPVQAAEPGRGGRRAAAHRHRQGAEGPAARRWSGAGSRACSSDRGRAGHPLRPAGLPPVRRRARP